MKKMKTMKKIIEKIRGISTLRKYRNLSEDFYDTLIAASRIDEPRQTLEEVKQGLIDNRKLTELNH